MAQERVRKSTVVLNRLTNTVGTSATRIAPNDPKRLHLLVVNTGASALWVNFTQSVSTQNGIYLSPQGGAFSLLIEEDHEVTWYELWGVAEGSPTTISCLEVLSLEE